MSRPSGRSVSITFDDGLQAGARAAADIMAPYGLAATFYVVTGWVEPVRAPVGDTPNQGRSHGDWDFWRGMVKAGHEVGSHTFSHFKAGGRKALLTPWRVASELSKSAADLRREIPQAGHTISMPWNQASPLSDFLVRREYSACRLGGGAVQYNHLDRLSPYALKSWAPGPRHGWQDYIDVIEATPEGGWLIFGFHSLGDEGWEPLAPDFFSRFCAWLAGRDDIEVATVRAITDRARSG